MKITEAHPPARQRCRPPRLSPAAPPRTGREWGDGRDGTRRLRRTASRDGSGPRDPPRAVTRLPAPPAAVVGGARPLPAARQQQEPQQCQQAGPGPGPAPRRRHTARTPRSRRTGRDISGGGGRRDPPDPLLPTPRVAPLSGTGRTRGHREEHTPEGGGVGVGGTTGVLRHQRHRIAGFVLLSTAHGPGSPPSSLKYLKVINNSFSLQFRNKQKWCHCNQSKHWMIDGNSIVLTLLSWVPFRGPCTRKNDGLQLSRQKPGCACQ